ncbi:alpha/beta-hydrolase [Thozetella sp. PMI_491]|nr:alpha/beta-hydrolase [Thozetella sp. PMI_491]
MLHHKLLFARGIGAFALFEFDSWPHQRIALDKVSIHFRYAGTGPPLLLVHGNPQYSLTWRTIGPILAEKYTVIAPDNRGAGDSSIPPDGDYTAASSAEDLKAVLDFLNITSAYVFSHDKGTGMAYALAAKYPSLVRMLGVSEYILPGFGYAETSGLAPYWDLYQNWQLAFFGVTDAAEFFISGKERQMLEWYFFHGSYSGGLSVPNDVVTSYTDSISKPGFLRAMLGPFSAQTVAADTEFFNSTLGTNPVTMPVLALGGEASMGVALELGYSAVTANLTTDIVPKAGHWIADENPTWVAGRIARFLAEDPTPLPSVNLSSLADQVTLTIGFLGTLGNAALYVGI